jgi:2-polyprenyl-3-methyl-5-hydroxy-6-metoxy-1,4-benzoquinol methylase
MSSAPSRSKHLPYVIDPSRDRSAFYETHWKRVSLSLLLKHCGSAGQTVLDYGCGRGETLQFFGEAGFKVTGTDVDPECVRLASRFGPACALNPADPVGQFGARSFDIVTCFHVLEHVENPRQTLGALSQIARRFLVLAVPNLRYLHQITVRRFDLRFVNQGHLQSWDHWHFLNLATNYCGLELVEWGSDATMLPLLSNLSQKLLGTRATIALETGIFRWLFPYHCISVLGLFRIK